MVRRLRIACLIVLTAPAIAQCSPGKAEQAAATAHQRQAELLRYQTDELTTQVPPSIRGQITQLKNSLTDTTDSAMSCAPPAENSIRIQSHLAKLLQANQSEKPLPEPSDKMVNDIYGAGLKVAVSTPANATRLRIVKLSFGVDCGLDTILLIYEPTASGWQRTLIWQSSEYKEVSGAFGDFFQYVLFPGNSGTPWKIAVAHGHPWCTSRWSSLDIDLLAPSENPATPRVVWHTSQGYVREASPRMTSKPDGFELGMDVGTIESNVMVRKGIFRYRITGDKVERVQPIALDGRGFVDAWLQAPWSDAQQWSLPAFEKVHEIFTKAREDHKTYISYTYGPVRACQSKGRYQVQMNADPGGPQFYTIEERPPGYVMVGYGTTPDERCGGPDLMKKP